VGEIKRSNSQQPIEMASLETVEDNDENEYFTDYLEHNKLSSAITTFPKNSEHATKQKPSKKPGKNSKKKKFGDMKNSVNRTVLGSI
jgi:hypothetical protein